MFNIPNENISIYSFCLKYVYCFCLFHFQVHKHNVLFSLSKWFLMLFHNWSKQKCLFFVSFRFFRTFVNMSMTSTCETSFFFVRTMARANELKVVQHLPSLTNKWKIFRVSADANSNIYPAQVCIWSNGSMQTLFCLQMALMRWIWDG